MARPGFGNDSENRQGASEGQIHGARCFRLESDAGASGPNAGKGTGAGRPSNHDYNSRDDGILEEQAESEKNSA